MKICSRHYSDLAEAIKKKGMGSLVSNSEPLVRERARLWLAGEAGPGDFDPLIAAVIEINGKAEQIVGHHYIGKDECPICAVSRHLLTDVGDSWVDNVTDLMLIVAKTNGLM